MATLHARQQKILKPVSQTINNGKEEVLKEEHQVIYDVFFERMEAYRDWAELETHYPGQKEIFAFILNEQDSILKNINPKDVNSLSEENFRQLLSSIFKKIRKQNSAKKGNLTDDEISQIIAKCVVDARGTEAKDILVKSGGGLFGIDTDPKDISGSIKRGVLKKLPFGGSKEEDNKPSLRGTQVVKKILRNSVLPIIFALLSLLISSLIFGFSLITLAITVIVLLVTEVKEVKSLFSNDKEGTVYNTNKEGENILFVSSHDTEIVKKARENEAKFKQAEDEQKKGELRKKIGGDISEILSDILQNKEINKAAAPVIEQATGQQAAQAEQKGAVQEESTSQTQWADTVRTGNKVGAGRS
ncbi:MAG: hypothetical protein PG981_000807 [Wolbachia endosymbiont of Ctenocephalides orientis wCori]|nr:MAG: hypothetical protein PG981_000807 [Wolbachia endosymbiont of Ctenocephalides orientis wCori]